jgi:hypothetical protein
MNAACMRTVASAQARSGLLRLSAWLVLGWALSASVQAAPPQAVSRPEAAPASEHVASWWQALQRLCHRAYGGQLIDPQARDADLAGKPLVMHVRECRDGEIKIPFHVGEDRSRTWVLTRTAQGIRLKHDHRHADGSEDTLTQYGGDSLDVPDEQQVSFAADEHTARILPAAKTNVWTLALTTMAFRYSLRRIGTDRRFDVEFDLSKPVAIPPAPWGHP